MQTRENWFQRFLLPGLAFKAVVIGGGYATGRELVSYFLPSGPQGGLYAMALAAAVWSVVCVVTFIFALQTRSLDYRSFFTQLLGPFWPLYEIAYILALVVILAVFAAAAGSIGHALFDWHELVGALALMAIITLIAALGNDSVETLFKYVSFLLYGTYLAFVALAFSNFGDRISDGFSSRAPTTGWLANGLTYAGYNIIGAIVILPVTRHLVTRRDAVIAGLLAGPLAMVPACLFFICMIAYYPQIESAPLPSDFLLERLNLPWFRFLFQLMIFSALLESGTGGVHAFNQRIASSYLGSRGRELPKSLRLAVTLVLLTGSVFIATKFGLVTLIADGFRWLAYIFLGIYVLPLMTKGLWQILTFRPRMSAGSA